MRETDGATGSKFLVLSLLPLRTGHVGGRSTPLLLLDDDDNNETLLNGIVFLLVLLREIVSDGIFKEEFLSEAQVVHAASHRDEDDEDEFCGQAARCCPSSSDSSWVIVFISVTMFKAATTIARLFLLMSYSSWSSLPSSSSRKHNGFVLFLLRNTGKSESESGDSNA